MAEDTTKGSTKRLAKNVLSDTTTEKVTQLRHVPYKGEKLTPSKRKDHLYDPNQAYTARNGRPL